MSSTILVLCGPSGCGKSTLISRLMTDFPAKFGLSVSHTTRPPRAGEQDAVHYYFAPRAQVEKMRNAGEFIETAEVHGNLYGTSVAAVEAVRAIGKICILDIDIQGVQAVKQKLKNVFYVFLAPPSIEILEKRLRNRGTENEEKIQLRLKNALIEMEASKRDNFWDAVLVNDQLDLCYKELKHLIERNF